MNNRSCHRLSCNEIILSSKRKATRYCSPACSSISKSEEKLRMWLTGEWSGAKSNGELANTIKKFLLAEAAHSCSRCGWMEINPSTGRCPLEVDHIDGNSSNNRSDNLQVLCPNCHSITPTYKALNKTGRGWRKKYNQFELLGRKQADSKVLRCSCGKAKSRQAKTCKVCYLDAMRVISGYPDIKRIIAGIEIMGCLSYAKSIGKSDNAVRKHLRRNGYTGEIKKKKSIDITFCFCGVKLTSEQLDTRRTRCDQHMRRTIEYPPIDDIMAGIAEIGWSAYARSINAGYPSNIKKHLIRRGINVSDIGRATPRNSAKALYAA